jgi:hypothetical protein
VIHNYGHGGRGYESSYGCAQAAVKLVDEALQDGDEGVNRKKPSKNREVVSESIPFRHSTDIALD